MYFFFRSKNVQGTSSRHCQSGGIRARMKLLTLGTSLEFHVFFSFHSSLYKQEWSILEFISLYFPYEHSERLPSFFFFFLCPISISGIMNAKKNSKLEREDKSNGNPLLHHGIYYFFHENFTINIHNDSLVFWFLPCLYFQKNECKKPRNSTGKTRTMDSHFYNMYLFFFLSQDFSYEHSQRFLPIFFFALLVFLE